MEIIQRDELIRQLKDMEKLVKKCPKDMYFVTNVEFSGIDPRFMELGKKFTIEKQLRQQKEQAKAQNAQGNV